MKDPISSQSLCLVNGLPQEQIPVSDRGLAYGDGVFETLRFKNRYLPVWPLHRQRLTKGAGVLGLDLEIVAVEWILEAALDWAEREQLSDGVIKIIVTRGAGGHGYRPLAKAVPTVIMILKGYEATFDRAIPVELKSCSYKLAHNPALAGMKHLNRLEQVMAARSVLLETTQQGLVFDKEDRIIETLHHNLFTVKAGTLYTPDLANCGVEGTLRRAILETFAPAIGCAVAVEHLYRNDLETADEAFICNALHGIMPIGRWQDTTWVEGAVTQQLKQAISSEWSNFYD
jgi:4-amino-4-deoxychorismate lyase